MKVTASPFKRGDKVEALFGGLTQYYPAVVENVRIDADSADYLFDLLYEDGDRENDVTEKNIRIIGGAAPVKAVETTPPEKSKTRSTVEIMRQVVNTAEEEESEDDEIRPKFGAGDKIQGFFPSHDQWFDGTILGVNAIKDNKISYRIMYDDGDRDEAVSEANLRLKPEKVRPVLNTKGSDLDDFLNGLSDDEGDAGGALDGGKPVDGTNQQVVLSHDEYDEDFDA
eukprot:gene31491-38896_t